MANTINSFNKNNLVQNITTSNKYSTNTFNTSNSSFTVNKKVYNDDIVYANENNDTNLDFSNIDVYINYLKQSGISDNDITRIKNGEITLQELLIEIEQDDSNNFFRYRNLQEQARINNIYQSIESIDSLKEKIKNIDDILKNNYGNNLPNLTYFNMYDMQTTADIHYLINERKKCQDYLKNIEDNFGFLQEYNINFKDMKELNSLIRKDSDELFNLYYKINNTNNSGREYDALMIVYNRLLGGEDLDSILDSPAALISKDKVGNTIYEYPDLIDGFLHMDMTHDSVTYRELYKDSELFKQLKGLINEKEANTLFGKRKFKLYESTKEQEDFFNTIKKSYDEIKETRDKELEELNKSKDNLSKKLDIEKNIKKSIKNEVDYYVDNVHKYIINEDFSVKSKFDEKCKKDLGKNIYSKDKKVVANLLSCIINGEVIVKNGSLQTKDGKFIASADGNMMGQSTSLNISAIDPILDNLVNLLPYMTDKEKQIFNYILATQGNTDEECAKSAYKYLETIMVEMDNRWLVDKQTKDKEYATDHPVLASVGSIFATPIEGLNAFAYSMNSYFTNERIYRSDVYSSGDIWRSTVSQNIASEYGSGWAFAYNTGMSMADTGLLIGANVLTGGTITPILSASLMGSRAYVSTLNDALDRGLSDGSAILLASTSAVIETAMESYSAGHLYNLEGKLGNSTLGVVDKFSSTVSNITSTLINNPEHAKVVSLGATQLFNILAHAVSQGIVEGEEEFCTEVLNYWADYFIANDLSNYCLSIENYLNQGCTEDEAVLKTLQDHGKQIWQAFLGGFASGFCFGSFSGTKTTINTSYAIANNMYNNLQGGTAAQNFSSALNINHEQLEMFENASKVQKEVIKEAQKQGVNLSTEEFNNKLKIKGLSDAEIDILNKGTVEMQASNNIKQNINNSVADTFVNIKNTANNAASNTSQLITGFGLNTFNLLTGRKSFGQNINNNVDYYNKVLNEGIVHITSDTTANLILDSNYVKKSSPLASYGRGKAYFFAGTPSFESVAFNLDSCPKVLTGVKIMPNESQMNNLQVRYSDGAIQKVGDFDFENGQAIKVYYGLSSDENGNFIYKEITEEQSKNWVPDVSEQQLKLINNKGAYALNVLNKGLQADVLKLKQDINALKSNLGKSVNNYGLQLAYAEDFIDSNLDLSKSEFESNANMNNNFETVNDIEIPKLNIDEVFDDTAPLFKTNEIQNNLEDTAPMFNISEIQDEISSENNNLEISELNHEVDNKTIESLETFDDVESSLQNEISTIHVENFIENSNKISKISNYKFNSVEEFSNSCDFTELFDNTNTIRKIKIGEYELTLSNEDSINLLKNNIGNLLKENNNLNSKNVNEMLWCVQRALNIEYGIKINIDFSGNHLQNYNNMFDIAQKVSDKNIEVTKEILNVINNKGNNDGSINNVDFELSANQKRAIFAFLNQTENLTNLSKLSEMTYSDKVLINKFMKSGVINTILNMNKGEGYAINFYGGSNWTSYNRFLDGEISNNADTLYDYSSIDNSFTSLMDKSRLKSTIILQRSASEADFDGIPLDNLQGKVLTHNRHRSTCIQSYDKIGTGNGGIAIGTDSDTKKVQIDYICPAGTKCVNLGILNQNEVEMEALLGKDQRIRYDVVKSTIASNGDEVNCVLAVVLPEGVSDNVSIKDLVDADTYEILKERYNLNEVEIEMPNLKITDTTNNNKSSIENGNNNEYNNIEILEKEDNFNQYYKISDDLDSSTINAINNISNSNKNSIKDIILSQITPEMSQIEIAKLLYVELGKKVDYSTEFKKARSIDIELYKEMHNKVMTLSDLSSDNSIVCINWAQLYSELLEAAGFDQKNIVIQRAVDINNKYEYGLHAGIYVILDDGSVIMPDLTAPLGKYPDFYNVKVGNDTSGFLYFTKEQVQELSKQWDIAPINDLEYNIKNLDTKGYKAPISKEYNNFLNYIAGYMYGMDFKSDVGKELVVPINLEFKNFEDVKKMYIENYNYSVEEATIKAQELLDKNGITLKKQRINLETTFFNYFKQKNRDVLRLVDDNIEKSLTKSDFFIRIISENDITISERTINDIEMLESNLIRTSFLGLDNINNSNLLTIINYMKQTALAEKLLFKDGDSGTKVTFKMNDDYSEIIISVYKNGILSEMNYSVFINESGKISIKQNNGI